jgi:hypothetical protein
MPLTTPTTPNFLTRPSRWTLLLCDRRPAKDRVVAEPAEPVDGVRIAAGPVAVEAEAPGRQRMMHRGVDNGLMVGEFVSQNRPRGGVQAQGQGVMTSSSRLAGEKIHGSGKKLENQDQKEVPTCSQERTTRRRIVTNLIR